MKPRLYIETTIPSYLTSKPSNDIIVAGHQLTTRRWWEKRKGKFELFVSQFVVDEVMQGDPRAAEERLNAIVEISDLEITEDVLHLAGSLLEKRVIPPKAVRDAYHIAVATVHNMDYLMTWNCTHMANAQIIRTVERTCRTAGFQCPLICTPEELMGEDYVG